MQEKLGTLRPQSQGWVFSHEGEGIQVQHTGAWDPECSKRVAHSKGRGSRK